MTTIVLMEFWQWMNRKYIEWRGDTRGTISEFAQFIGVKQQVMSDWTKPDGKKPGSKSLALLASKYGDEVYDILGLPRPREIPFARLPLRLRSRLDAAMREIDQALTSQQIDPNSDAAVELARRILSMHGFTDTHIEKD